MKIDESGGASANDRLEERLASRFATELDRAERDYPVLRLRPRGAAESGRRRRVWPRLVAVPVGIAAILLVAIVGSPWLIPGAAPVAPAPGSSGVSPGSDGIPLQIDGQRVYRAPDQASFASLSGSFLLGGPFTKPEFVPPCPMPVDKSAAEQQLIPYCYLRTIDGLQVAPESDIDEPNDEPVVARVHVNDPLAAQCPAGVRAQCQAGIVVETVVWRGATFQISPTPLVAPPTSGNAASSEVTGPSAGSSYTGAVQIGPDGVPTAIGGEKVYRASNLSTSLSFLFGGKLTLDVSPCPSALPAATVANPPACGYWMLDGVKVGTNVDLPDSLRDQIVVARVEQPRVLAVCPGVGCSPIETMMVAQIVWQTLTPPPPLVPSAS